MVHKTRDAGTSYIRGVFESSSELITYRYVGCSSVLIDRHHAQGRMAIRRDMRLPGGALLTAPLAIAMLDTAGINIDPYYHAACTHIDVHLWDPGRDIDEIQVLGTVRREARTAVFTEAVFVDAAQPERLLGAGTVGWSIIGATPAGFSYRDPGRGLPDSDDLPALVAGFGAEEMAYGRFRLGGLSTVVGTEVLHHGPILVMSEAAASASAQAQGAPAAVDFDRFTPPGAGRQNRPFRGHTRAARRTEHTGGGDPVGGSGRRRRRNRCRVVPLQPVVPLSN